MKSVKKNKKNKKSMTNRSFYLTSRYRPPLLVAYSFLILLLISCGKDEQAEIPPLQQQEVTEGHYTASLFAVNDKVAAQTSGEAHLWINGDEFKVNIKLTGAPDGTHHQYLHSGENCPNFTSDQNSDGYIDAAEMFFKAGAIIMPLDSDLNSWEAGENNFPSGNYHYKKTASYSLMTSDLKHKGIRFFLEGKVVAIYGVPKKHRFPSTVVGRGELDAHTSLPIACGVLVKVIDSPTDPEWQPERETRPRAPRRTAPYRPIPDNQINDKPPTNSYEEDYPSWGERMRDRLRRWRGRGETQASDQQSPPHVPSSPSPPGDYPGSDIVGG
jgi:hypothetical protein